MASRTPAFGPTKAGEGAAGKPKAKAPSKNAPPRPPRSAGFGSPMMGTMSAPPSPPPGPGMAGLAGGGPMPPPRPAAPAMPPPAPPIATSAMVPPPTPGIGGAGRVGRGGSVPYPKATGSAKERVKKDRAYDRAHGIKEDSPADKKMDKKMGISEDDEDEYGKGGKGRTGKGGSRYPGEKNPGKGADLSAKARQSLPKSDFGLPGKGKGPKGAGAGSYPMPNKKHAALAKGFAKRFASPAERAKIDAKADRVEGKGGDYNSGKNTKVGRGGDFNSSVGKGGSGQVRRMGNRSGSGRAPAGGR